MAVEVSESIEQLSSQCHDSDIALAVSSVQRYGAAFVWGDEGSGKTALAQAVCRQLASQAGAWRPALQFDMRGMGAYACSGVLISFVYISACSVKAVFNPQLASVSSSPRVPSM